MPDIKKYSTGNLGNKWPRHENTDHLNTKGLAKDGTAGIEAYIDEDIVRAYDDNRPLKNLLTNDQIVASSIDALTKNQNISAFLKDVPGDWDIKVGQYGYYVDPEDFSRQVNITPIKINVSSATTSDGFIKGSTKKVVGFERDNGTTLWVKEHDWFYDKTPLLDDPDGAYTGYYKPIYSDAPSSSFPGDYKDYRITIRQKYTTGAVYSYDIYLEDDFIVPLSTSTFEINNEITSFFDDSQFPGYDLYPDTYSTLKSNNLGQLEIGEDTELYKALRRESHKLLANEFDAESGAFKANLGSDVFRANKSNDISRIESDSDFINAFGGINIYNSTSKVFFNKQENQSGVLIPLVDNRNFLGNTDYSFEVNIGDKKEVIEISSPETRAYQDLILNKADPEDIIYDTTGEQTFNFNIKLNSEVGDASSTYTTIDVSVNDPDIYSLINAINQSFYNNSIYAEAKLKRIGITYNIRIYSRSSGDYSKINITPGTSDLASNLGGSYDTPVDGKSNWYIYYNSGASNPEVPDSNVYRAIRDSGITTANDFNTGDLNIGNQIFNAMVSAGFNDFEIGISTELEDLHTNELYIKDLASSKGYIELNMSAMPNADSGLEPLKTYYFQLDVDDRGFEEFSFTTTTDTTYNGVINAINKVVSGVAIFNIEPTTEITITSASTGPQSTVKTADGLSGDNLFGAAYPAAGFTPTTLHSGNVYGSGRIITINSINKSSFTTFTDQVNKRMVFTKNNDKLYIAPNTDTDKKDRMDTLYNFESIGSNTSPYEKWSTHNDRLAQIKVSNHASWALNATITNIEEKNIDGTKYLFVGNSNGQVFILEDNLNIYNDDIPINNFVLLSDPNFSDIATEKINKFFLYNDGDNNKDYLFIVADTKILYSEVTNGITQTQVFNKIEANSSLYIPNVSAPVFSEIRDVVEWKANVSSSVHNRYLIFVGNSDNSSSWDYAPIIYALYKPSEISNPIEDRFNWYAEEIYRKTQIDDITSIVVFNGLSDPEQSNQVFIANNVNGPELWSLNSQNNDVELGTFGDDRFNRFSWAESNYDNGNNPLKLDEELERINKLATYDNRIFIGGIRLNKDYIGGLYSYGLNKLQKYFRIDVHNLFYDKEEDLLYINSSEGNIGNTIPSILKISQEKSEGRAQIFSRESLVTVSNWPADSSFRIKLTGFIVGGVNFDGEYNIQFNGQGKSSLQELVNAINGSDGEGLKTAQDIETGIENDITPVIRARAIEGYKIQGAAYSPYYKFAIESKIPEDIDAGHSSLKEVTQSNCEIEVRHPTIGTTIVGTGADTIEIDPETIGTSNLKLKDWNTAKAYSLKRIGTDQLNFSGSSYIDITNKITTGYEILAGSLRVKTNEDDELGFSQGRGQILETNTPTGLLNDATKYGLKITFNESLYDGDQEITEVTLPSDVSESLSGKYWLLNGSIYSSPLTEYYIWYNVNNESTDPNVAGKTGVEVNITSNSSDIEVANATLGKLNELASFDVTITGATLTITNTTSGDVTDASDVDAGLISVIVTQQGTDPNADYMVNWINLTGSNIQTIWELKDAIDAQLTHGVASLETIGATAEYCDILFTSNLIGNDSSVKIEVDNTPGIVNLIGKQALDLMPNKPVYGNNSLNTSGTQTLGYTWENADFFYTKNHPSTGTKRIYIPNGNTRIDPGATVWVNFWEYLELTKIEAKNTLGENNIPASGEWTFDLEEKKIVLGDEPSKTFPQDLVFVDVNVEKKLAKLDLGSDLPSDQIELSNKYHLSQPYNIDNTEIALARAKSQVIALDYGVKLWSSNYESPLVTDYNFFLPRVDVYKANKEADYYGNRTRIIKGIPDPNNPYVEMPLIDQGNDAYIYTTYINSARYQENNITEIPWYKSNNLTSRVIYLSDNTHFFKSEDNLVSTKGLRPLRGKNIINKYVENNNYSLVGLKEPINTKFYRKRYTNIHDIDTYYLLFVDPINGSDINNGKTRSNAFETLTAAMANATPQRNNIIILKANNNIVPVLDTINFTRNIHLNIYAEQEVKVKGANINGSVYFEGIDFTPQYSSGFDSKVILGPQSSPKFKYCNFNTVELEDATFENGLNLLIENSTFEKEGIIFGEDPNTINIEEKISIECNHCYFKKAEIFKFKPNSYNESVTNDIIFNNITNGLYKTGYIIDTDKFIGVQIKINKSILTSGDSNKTTFASSAPIILNESISYVITNNESYGTGSILSNDSQVVDEGNIDIIEETGAQVSIARGYEKDSVGINYINKKYDTGAFIEDRFENTIKNDETVSSEKSYLTFEEKFAQYYYEINSENVTFYIRFKPTGSFQQQGVIFDSRYDKDYNRASSTFNLNGQDFIQLVYNNKTYGLSYLSSNNYSFKVVMSNGNKVDVAVVGPQYNSTNHFEYNEWHEIGFLLNNSKIYNPKYDSANITELDENRRQTIVYTLFDRQIDRIFTLKHHLYQDNGGNEITNSNWKPGNRLSTHFNIGRGWSADWIDTAQGKAWSTWTELNYNMILDEYLISRDKLPLNIIANLNTKKIIDINENNHRTPSSDDEHSIVVNHCSNSHPFSENGIEPYQDYFVNFRPYEGYQTHAIAIEDSSENFVEYGKINKGNWFDRGTPIKWSTENLDILGSETGDAVSSLAIIANNEIGEFTIYFIDSEYNLVQEVNILPNTAIEAKISKINNNYIVAFVDSADNKPYYITITPEVYTTSSKKVINNATSSNIDFCRGHDDNEIAVTYKEGTLGYVQTISIPSGAITHGRTEFSNGNDILETNILESFDENGDSSYLIFYREASTDDLKYVMYNRALSTIILSHTSIVQGQLPINLKAIRTPNNDYFIKWKDYVSGGDSPVRFLILSRDGAKLVPETDVFADSKDDITSDNIILLKTGALLFSSIENGSGHLYFRLFSQNGEELETSDALRGYNENPVDSIYLEYPYNSNDITSLIKIDNESYIISLQTDIPTLWYKDATGEFDSYNVEVYSTMTFFGQALRMVMNHTTSPGETGEFVADAETQDLSQFDTVADTNGEIVAINEAALHGSYGYQFKFDNSGSELYTDKNITTLGPNSYARFYLELDKYFSLTGTQERNEIARFGNSGDPVILELEYNNPLVGGDGKFKLKASTTSFSDETTSLSVIEYSYSHFIEVRWFNDVSGGWQVWVDGNLTFDHIGQDTTTIGNANYISIGSKNTTNSEPSIDSIIRYDDIRVENTAIGEYIAGLGQGTMWTPASIDNPGELHYFSGYYYLISGNSIIELEGPSLDHNIEILLNNDGTYEHLTYGLDTVSEIKTDLINWNGVFRLSVGFTPDYADQINIKVKTLNSDDDFRIDDLIIDNIKLEENEYASSIGASSTGYIAYPVSLKEKGNAFFKILPQFKFDTTKHRTIFSGVNENEAGLPYTTHELYYDKNDKKFKLTLQNVNGTTVTVESEEFGDGSLLKRRSDINERHTIGANWDTINGEYEIFIDDHFYRLSDQPLDNFKGSGISTIGNDVSKNRAVNSLIDLFRLGDEPLTHYEMLKYSHKIQPFTNNNNTNIGDVIVNSLSFYGLSPSDEATIYGERDGETSSLVLEVGDGFEDRVVIRQNNMDLAVFGAGALIVNGVLRANEMSIEATTTIASYDDHVTVNYGFSGTPPEYNDGYFEVERGNLTNAEIRFDESQDAWVFHDGSNRNITIDGTHIGTWKDDNDFNLVSNGSGDITLSTDSSTNGGSGDGTMNRNDGIERVKISTTESVINEPGLDHDFRVEALSGVTNRIKTPTHLLFTDAQEKQVLIGRDSGDATSGTLVVNYKETIQSDDTVSFGSLEFKNDNGLRAGYIGSGNGSNQWDIVSEIKTLQLTGIDFDVDLSSTDDDAFNLQTAGGIKWDINGTSANSWLLNTEGGVKWFLDGNNESTDNFEIYIQSPYHRSFNLMTAGGVRWDINGTDTTSGQEDKFKVEIANTIEKSFHVDTSGGAHFDVDNGFYVEENTNSSYFNLDTNGKFNIYTENTDANSVLVETQGGIDLNSNGSFDLDSNNGIFLNENSGTYLNIASNGVTDLYSVNGITLEEDSGSKIVINPGGGIEVNSTSGGYLNIGTSGNVNLYSADLANANVNITARNSGDIILTAEDDDITSISSRETIKTDELRVIDSGSNDLINAKLSAVELYHNNIWRLKTTSNGIDVNGNITVGGTSGSESTFQNNSGFDGQGFFESPWIYAPSLEAPGERGSGGTAVLLGADTGFTNADEIALVTQGSTGLRVTNTTDVEIENDALIKGDITINGYLQFDNGTNVMTIQNIVDELVGPGSDDTLVTEHAVIEYVEANYGQVLGTDGNYITLDALNGTELDRIIAPYAQNANNLDGINSSQFLRSDSNDVMDAGTNTTLTIKSNDSGESTIQLFGDSQGTGRVFVGQSSSHGGGIEYNGDGSPSASGSGSDYITLWRRDGGTDEWTARNRYNNNNWEFRGNLTANGSTVHTESNHGSGSNTDVNTSGRTIIDRFYTDDSGHLTSVSTRDLGTVVTRHYSTNTNLGTSDSYVPTQNAVKTYVDNNSSSGTDREIYIEDHPPGTYNADIGDLWFEYV